MSETILAIELIASDPNVRNGRPIIRGRTLRVQDVVAAHLIRHESLEDVAHAYDLSMAELHAALAYYYTHQDEISDHLAEDAARYAAHQKHWQSKLPKNT